MPSAAANPGLVLFILDSTGANWTLYTSVSGEYFKASWIYPPYATLIDGSDVQTMGYEDVWEVELISDGSNWWAVSVN
jgi:hypothetical protein